MDKNEAIGWINVVQKQPFPIVSYEVLRELYRIAELEEKYPKHDYLVARNQVERNEIMDRILKSLHK